MTEDNAALTATIKAGAGYDAPWIVVRADNPEQLQQRLNAVANGLTGPLVAATQVLQGEWAAQQSGGQPNPGNQNFGGNSGGNQGGNGFGGGQGNGGFNGNNNQGGGGGGGKTCVHGAMEWKDFTSKAGNHVKGWFCQAPNRNDQCKPEYVR